LASEDNNLSRCAVEGWLKIETARKLFEMAGLNYDDLKAAALKRNFKGLPLGLKASVTLKNNIRRAKSRTVIALLSGSEHPDEYIFYMAHWDHLGVDPTLKGDQIFNGAVDNATGTGGLIELAEAFNKLPSQPSRSIVFMSVTAE
jgi:Zn-dependent M28 family amino/carboxypeptidase